MDIHDIKRLPTQLDPKQSNGSSKVDVPEKAAIKSESVSKPAQAPVAEAAKQQPEQAAQEVSKPVELEAALDKMRDHAQSLNRDLQFQVDSDTGRTVVTILNSETQEVVRQIPSEEVLELTKNLEDAQGLIFNSRA